jgi:hypothetical protein
VNNPRGVVVTPEMVMALVERHDRVDDHGHVYGVVIASVRDYITDKIRLYTIPINSAEDLAKEIARMANLSMALGYRLEDENRLLTRWEAYQQLGQSASLFVAVFEYAKKLLENSTGPKQFGPDHRWDA